MTIKTHWTNLEIEAVQMICHAGDAGLDLRTLRDAVPLPLNRGWTTFDSALTTLGDKLRRAGLSLTFTNGRAALAPVDRLGQAA